MPGSMPPTSLLDWLSSTTAMIVLFWSRATRGLLKSFGWGIAALHRLDAATKLPCPRRPPHSIHRSRVRRPIFQCRLWLVPANRKVGAKENRHTKASGPFPAEPMVRILFPPATSQRRTVRDRAGRPVGGLEDIGTTLRSARTSLSVR